MMLECQCYDHDLSVKVFRTHGYCMYIIMHIYDCAICMQVQMYIIIIYMLCMGYVCCFMAFMWPRVIPSL